MMNNTIKRLIAACLFAAAMLDLSPAWARTAVPEIRLGELHGVEVWVSPGSVGKSFTAVFKGGVEHKAVAIRSVEYSRPGEELKGLYASDPAVMWGFDERYPDEGRDRTIRIDFDSHSEEGVRDTSFLKSVRLKMELAVQLKDGTVLDGTLSTVQSPLDSAPAAEKRCGDHYEYLITVDSMSLADIMDIQSKFHEVVLNEYKVGTLGYAKKYPDYFQQGYGKSLVSIDISFVLEGPENVYDVRVTVEEGFSISEGYSTDDKFAVEVDELGDRMLKMVNEKIAGGEKMRFMRVSKTYQPGVNCGE